MISFSSHRVGAYVVPRKIPENFKCITTPSSIHHHYVPDASPIFACRTPKDHRRLLFADVAQIIPRIFPYTSPNIRRHFDEISPNISRRFVNASHVCFLVGPHVRYRHRSSPEHVFFIASTKPDILALVGT